MYLHTYYKCLFTFSCLFFYAGSEPFYEAKARSLAKKVSGELFQYFAAAFLVKASQALTGFYGFCCDVYTQNLRSHLERKKLARFY